MPSGLLDRRPKDGALVRSLRCQYDILFLRGQVLREILHNTFWGEQQKAIFNRLNLTETWRRRKFAPYRQGFHLRRERTRLHKPTLPLSGCFPLR